MRCTPIVVVAMMTAGIFLPQRGAAVAAQAQAEQPEVRQAFLERVGQYVTLHRNLEKDLPPERVTADLEALFAPHVALAREMRKARVNARRGDIFTPETEAYFRSIIAATLPRHGVTDLLAIIEDENTVHTPPAVNGDYPAGRSIPLIPPCLLAVFPVLPPEVRYSFVGHHLILWDLHAGLIVDFMPRAVPITTEPCVSAAGFQLPASSGRGTRDGEIAKS